MSQVVQSNRPKITLKQLAEKARYSNTPVEMPVRESDVVVVAFPLRDYERWRLVRKAEKDLVTRAQKTRARYKSETLRALRRYEKKYKMTSAEFYRRFQAGELPEDERDYFDWRVRYNSYLRMSRSADE